jgi:hypothetical protein
MFRNSRKLKDLEAEVRDLKLLCTQLTNNAISLMKEQAMLADVLKEVLEHQKVIDRLINTKYTIATANDDDDIIH